MIFILEERVEIVSSIDDIAYVDARSTRRKNARTEPATHSVSGAGPAPVGAGRTIPPKPAAQKEAETSYTPSRETGGHEEATDKGGATLGQFTNLWQGMVRKETDRKQEPKSDKGAGPRASDEKKSGGILGDPAPPAVDIADYQEKLTRELGPRVTIQNQGDIDKIEGKIPSLSELNQTFKELRNDPKIPWEAINEGCYARAHVASQKLLDKGYNTSKIFAMVDDPEMENDSNRLRAKNAYTKGEWQFHTAPLVFAKDDKTGKVDGYVLDPSLNREKPMKASEWLKSSWNGKFPVTLDITHADQYMPANAASPSVPQQFSMDRFTQNLEHATLTCGDYADVLEWYKEKARARR